MSRIGKSRDRKWVGNARGWRQGRMGSQTIPPVTGDVREWELRNCPRECKLVQLALAKSSKTVITHAYPMSHQFPF